MEFPIKVSEQHRGCLWAARDGVDRQNLAKIAQIDEELLVELITFFQLFQEATLAMKVFKQPTLQRVCYFKQSLLLHCDLVIEDV